MSSTSNEAIYRRIIDEIFNKGNMSVADELLAPSCVEHQRGGLGAGPEGIKRTATFLRAAFPDFTLTIEDLVVDGDKIWARQRGGGTNEGRFLGHPPTGKKVYVEVFDVCRFENGKMVEHWGVPDQLGILLGLGVIEAPSRTAPARA